MSSNLTFGYLGKLCRMVTSIATCNADAMHNGYPSFLDYELSLADPRTPVARGPDTVSVQHRRRMKYGQHLTAWLQHTDADELHDQMASYVTSHEQSHEFLFLAAGFHGGSGRIAAEKFFTSHAGAIYIDQDRAYFQYGLCLARYAEHSINYKDFCDGEDPFVTDELVDEAIYTNDIATLSYIYRIMPTWVGAPAWSGLEKACRNCTLAHITVPMDNIFGCMLRAIPRRSWPSDEVRIRYGIIHL